MNCELRTILAMTCVIFSFFWRVIIVWLQVQTWWKLLHFSAFLHFFLEDSHKCMIPIEYSRFRYRVVISTKQLIRRQIYIHTHTHSFQHKQAKVHLKYGYWVFHDQYLTNEFTIFMWKKKPTNNIPTIIYSKTQTNWLKFMFIF